MIARLQQNPLGPYLEQLATVLHRQGYAPSSIQDCLRAGDKFGHWLQRQGHNVTRIDETLLNHYVSGLERHHSGNLCKAAAGLSQMLSQGASFKEVADVLGHRSLQTTGIYAKLELEALASVALPWLGGAQ